MDSIGPYEIIERLGQGGMAQVYLARQRGPSGFQRQTVIKQIHQHLADDPDVVQRFHDEARLASLLNHPNIVRLEDFSEENGRPYIVLEHVTGDNIKSLSQRALAAGVGLPLRLTLQIGADIARALHYAHELKAPDGRPLEIVHRDVSPDNILLTELGQAKLLDFGIARATTNEQKTAAGVLKGKMSYFSPEQLDGANVSPQSDQFSLGVVLWELVCRARLFMRDDDLETLKAVKKCWVPAANRLTPETPIQVVKAIAQCTAKSPRYRHANCAQVAKILDQSLEQLGGRLERDDLKRWLDTLPPSGRPLPMLTESLINDRRAVGYSGTQTSAATHQEARGADEPRTRIVTSEMREMARLRSEDTKITGGKKARSLGIGLVLGILIALCAWFLLPSSPPEALPSTSEPSRPSSIEAPQEESPLIIAPAAPKKAPAKKKKRPRRRRR